jgi:hypothetical protein
MLNNVAEGNFIRKALSKELNILWSLYNNDLIEKVNYFRSKD